MKIIPVSETFLEYGEKILNVCLENKIRAEIDSSQESLSKKIRVAENEKVPVIAVVGEKEQVNQTVAVRLHKKGMKGTIPVDVLIKKIKENEQSRSIEFGI